MAAHPSDVLVDDLLRLYRANVARLESIVNAGLRRGLDPSRIGMPDQHVGDSTLAYRQRQRQQALAITAELERQAGTVGPLVIGQAYRSGLVGVDNVVHRGDAIPTRTFARGEFGRVHVRAVEQLGGQLGGSLQRAAQRAGVNVAMVFDRADALAGPLPASGRLAGVPFLGRRTDDPYRRLALEEVAGGTIGLDTRRQVSARLARRLVVEGVTDATTGYVDRSGRRWALDRYAGMVARTTTREATTAATGNRMREHGLDLVTISSHPHAADECTPYDGQTFSLDGTTPGYDVLDDVPPFHPNCAHVMTPAGANLDAFIADLERVASPPPPADLEPPAPRDARRPRAGGSSLTGPQAAGLRTIADGGNVTQGGAPQGNVIRSLRKRGLIEGGGYTDRPYLLTEAGRAALEPSTSPSLPPAARALDPAPPPPTVPPLSERSEPRTYPSTPDTLEAQRIARAVHHDPGPDDPGGWWASLTAEDHDAVKAAARTKRAANRALNVTLGDDLAKFIDRKWARDLRVRERLLDGELTIEEATDLAIDEAERLERRATEADIRKSLRGTGPFPCFQCGRFKARPSDVCAYCGDDPLPLGQEPHIFDLEYGASGPDTSDPNRPGRNRRQGRGGSTGTSQRRGR